MAIVGGLPAVIQNGQVEDANPVMADYNWIISQVNANACPATTGSAVQKANGFGGLTAAIAGTDYVIPSGLTAATNFIQGGTGAVTRTMQNKVREVSVNVMDFAGPTDWTTDISPAINKAVTYLASLGGGYLDFPANAAPGVMLSSVSITSSDIKLRGAGLGGPHDGPVAFIAATTLQWAGAVGGTMFFFQPTPTAVQKIKGCGMTGIYLFAGYTTAAYGVLIATHDAGVWDVAGNGFTQTLMYMGCIAANGFLLEPFDSQSNIVSLRSQNIFTGGGALVLDGRADGAANASSNLFLTIVAQQSTGPAIDLYNCDTNLFLHVLVSAVGTTGAGIRFNGSNTSSALVARENHFVDVTCANNTGTWPNCVVAFGTETYTHPSGKTGGVQVPNVIQFMNWADTLSLPFVGTGANLFWGTNRAPVGMQKRVQGVGAGHGIRVASDGWATQHGISGSIAGGGNEVITLPHALSVADASAVSVTPLNPATFHVNTTPTTLTIFNDGGAPAFFWWKVEGYIVLTTADWTF